MRRLVAVRVVVNCLDVHHRRSTVQKRRIGLGEIHAIAHGICRRKVSRHLLRHLPGRRPLRAALKDGHEPHAAQGKDVVAHRRVKDSSLPVVQNPGIGCVECKQKMARGLVAALAPIREKRTYYEQHPQLVEEIMVAGSNKARISARETMEIVRAAVKI